MEERFGRWWILGLLVVYLLLAAWIPAVDDEVYYWCWSKELQWSYYDHPPMSAYLIRLSTTLLGDTVVGFRLPACIASAFVVYVISRLTRSKPILLGVVLCPPFNLGAILITPDSPLVMFWAAYVWWSFELHRRLHAHEGVTSEEFVPRTGRQLTIVFWILGGVILGCGVLSKYTMGLAVPTSFVSLLLCKQSWKKWFPGYVFHGVVSFIVASPILIYNIGQNFEPLLFQWRHVAQRSSSPLFSAGGFVGGQMLLFGTMPFFLLPWVCVHFRQLCRNPRLRICTCFYAIPLVFFLYKSTQTRLEGNWALVCFVSFWPVASVWYQTIRQSRCWRWSTALAFLPPAVVTVLGTIHLITPLSIVPISQDRAYRQIAMNEASRAIADKIRERGENLPVYCGSYQMTSQLRFQSLDARQINGVSSRASHFTRPPQHLTDVNRAYVVAGAPLLDKFCDGFPTPDTVADIPIEYRGKTDVTLHLYLYAK